MAQKYAVAYHQVYRWVQRYLRDGWHGMNDKRGPADTHAPAEHWATEADAEGWIKNCPGVPKPLPGMLRRAGYSWVVIAGILFDLARM